MRHAMLFLLLVSAALPGWASGSKLRHQPSEFKISVKLTPLSPHSIDRLNKATVIAFGEATHGDQNILRVRNNLIAALVKQRKITTIALETGFAEGRKLDAFVQGGTGTASDVAAMGFTWGFGNYSENISLLRLLRKINRGRPPGKRIRLVGIDLSLGGPLGSIPTMGAVQCALEAVSDPEERERIRAQYSAVLDPMLQGGPISADGVANYVSLTSMLKDLVGDAASEDIATCAKIVELGTLMLQTQPVSPSYGGFPADAWKNIEARDHAMAELALRLAGQSRDGRLFLFAHASHVIPARMQGGRWATQQQMPRSMGWFLKERLKAKYISVVHLTRSRMTSGIPDLLASLDYGPASRGVFSTGLFHDTVYEGRPFKIGVNHDDEQIIQPASDADWFYISGAQDDDGNLPQR